MNFQTLFFKIIGPNKLKESYTNESSNCNQFGKIHPKTQILIDLSKLKTRSRL